ncbi:conserved oligomeric Golgi complex subunit 2 [Phlebotomus argentipes]|uniref:conserved oligomeric Golgi complex subunit 2 n=1 Tax=Phlebotomus argentipes TaxID=94469 RepID=UPI002892D905|nr:conserved oligomeric Golgi complex subunit 2 [Phlebotomus argentipes]
MLRNSEFFTLPAGPVELCFDKNEFTKKTFSVDDFLHEHRNAGSLEEIRDDLGVYLKVLRSAMIELINEDYADFVNLSANLIGLDKSIEGIQAPLRHLQQEIEGVKRLLGDNMSELSECLRQKRQLRNMKKSLKSLGRVSESMEKLSGMLEPRDDSPLQPALLERAAQEFVQMQFNINCCEKYLSEDVKMRIEALKERIFSNSRDFFLAVLQSHNRQGLEQSLRIYYTLEGCSVAEDIFRKEIVANSMDRIISESALQNSVQGLTGIYNKIHEFITVQMKDLLQLTQGRNLAQIKGYDFFLNSFWVEVERRLETHMASIFAPGNPDAFYIKYRATLHFLEQLEAILNSPEAIEQFRSHAQYKSFQTRWNLPVYFQIRFQEIAGAVEAACSRQISSALLSKAGDIQLVPFVTALSSISQCWSDSVFLPQLFHRFWKLSLQIVARLFSWTEEVLAVKKWNVAEMSIKRIDFLVVLLMDCMKLLGKLPGLLQMAMGKLPQELKEHSGGLKKCLEDTKEALKNKIENIEGAVLTELVAESDQHIRQVTDIPRLYRKTNRDVPSKPCSYVAQLLAPSQAFRKRYLNDISEEKMHFYLERLFSRLTEQFHTQVNEVLTSVQKTEESLRRLKNLREKSSSASVASTERAGMTDDDKIRLQLQVDVISWVNEIEKFSLKRHQIDRLPDLIRLVEESTKIRTEE